MIKYAFQLFVAFGIMLLAWSCSEESNLEPEGNWELTAPVALSPSESITLDETKAETQISFSWEAAKPSQNFGVRYTILIDTLGSTDFSTPILAVESDNGGKALTKSISAAQIDEALSLAGYPANANAQLSWAVEANCLSKQSTVVSTLNVKRFVHEYEPTQMFVTGTASETGTDMSKAIAMKRRNDTQGNPSQIYEIYTRLTAGKTYQFVSGQNVPAHRYGGKDGKLQKAGAAIAVTVTAEYRIVVDLATMSYTATKIDKWSIVGTPISGEWGGDVALQYQGMGVWKGTVDLLKAGGFVFRANGDWGYLLKHVKNTDNKLVMENDATSQGLSFEDVQSANIGSYICTLDLSAAGFTYSFIKDPSVVEPLVTPDKLFLLANNLKVKEFTKNGDVFSTADYIALQAGVTYSLNSAADGSGKSYNLAAAIGETTSPDGNKVEAKTTIAAGAGAISVARDQAYMLSFDFSTSKLSWHYYNIFLFHWDNANNGWDARKELKMTYVHPYTYETTQSLTAAFDIKFISPWDKDFGSDAPASLAGNIIASGGANLLCIKTSGNYKAKIVLSPDYKTGTYSIVAQ